MTCLAAAMVDSTANALLKSKISALDIMGGVYPSGTEYNFQTDPADAAYVMTHWTVQNGYPPMYLNGYGNGASVTSGIPTWFPPATLTTYIAGDNPGVYAGLEAGSLSRASFDVLSLCHAILGNTGCGFTVSASGTNTVNATSGANSWSSSTASGQYVITTSQTAAFYEAIFDGQSYNGGAAQYPLTLPGTIAADGSIQTNSVYPTYIPHAYLGACVGPGCTGSGTVTTSGTPSTNSLSKFCGSTVICNSSITDDGTTVGLAERLNQTIQTSTPNILLSPVEIPELILVPTGAGAWLRFWNLATSPTSEAWLGLCALPGGSGDDICVGNVANYGVTANQPFWAGYFGVPITGVFGFGAQAVYAGTGTLDSGFSRLAPGAVAMGNGTPGDKTGTLQAGVTATDPGCTTTAHIGKQWFNTTTTTTVYQVCLDVAGTVGWVVK
jgi:hypothetical protein